MGNITESPIWEDNVLQIEVGNSVGGGPSAVANLQAQDLANRTKWLKENKFDTSNFGEFYLNLASPAMTGSITLNGTTNNTVVMTGIVTTLGLEVGDVIRIQYSGYNKLHTVETITNNNSIIVNYEHANNRRNGSLKLPDFTGQATVTRIAKWFNASIGLGRSWVGWTTPERNLNSALQNQTGREMALGVFVNRDDWGRVVISKNGVNWGDASPPAIGGGSIPTPLWSIVPDGYFYKLQRTTQYDFTSNQSSTLLELR